MFPSKAKWVEKQASRLKLARERQAHATPEKLNRETGKDLSAAARRSKPARRPGKEKVRI